MQQDPFDIYAVHASFCGALANERRLRIMHLLGEGEHSVGEIAAALDLPPSSVSQHLRLMRNLGVVTFHKQGTQVYYALASQKFAEGYRLIREGLAEVHLSKALLLFPEDHGPGEVPGGGQAGPEGGEGGKGGSGCLERGDDADRGMGARP